MKIKGFVSVFLSSDKEVSIRQLELRGTMHSWVKGIQDCLNQCPHPLLSGDTNQVTVANVTNQVTVAKIHQQNLKNHL